MENANFNGSAELMTRAVQALFDESGKMFLKDLGGFRDEMKNEMATFRDEIRNEMATFRDEMKTSMKETENTLLQAIPEEIDRRLIKVKNELRNELRDDIAQQISHAFDKRDERRRAATGAA